MGWFVTIAKTQLARCLLTAAPSSIETSQLKELDIALTYRPKQS